ncbi:Hypothetical protein I595_1750 [Croceitalea dokdonensis DOKDO 023]|uniref:DUF3891 family protein n=1 Tax=Croceitalea dokdonensis DOKDO 023 TaxID=1300341 RepID=A0A0P7A607_9FLAO|nr:DUF3891 family protein [Croceitalea dokdonensis]KPM32101.1 Hypothetical protein I595_1750 [Croceitalea dokdonensis DOKDO 023]
MIVKQSNKGWRMIYQAAHGLLAGKIANELAHRLRPEHWLETLTAIIEHDDHQLNFDEKMYLNEIGVPIDFVPENTPNEKVTERAQRIYKKARIKSKYTAMLVSLHLEFLYGDMEDKEMREFLKTIGKDRQKFQKLYGLEAKKVQSTYQILRFCDRCSLILCKESLPTNQRSLEINTSIEGKTYYIYQSEKGHVMINPWPFEKENFLVAVEELLLQTAKFKDNQELQTALKGAKTVLLSWNFKKE